MTSPGFRASKQALWSAFQLHARPQVGDVMECLALDRAACDEAVLRFTQTPDLLTCFPYEDPLVVREALDQLAHRDDVLDTLWHAMQAHRAAMETRPTTAMEMVGDVDDMRDSRMTITLPSEAHKDFVRPRCDQHVSPTTTTDATLVNWTCFHCSLFVFLNDVLRCHVEPAALRQCRRALVPELEDGEEAESTVVMRGAGTTPRETMVLSGRASIGLVPPPPHSPPPRQVAASRVYHKQSLETELRCMIDTHSLPREAEPQPGPACVHVTPLPMPANRRSESCPLCCSTTSSSSSPSSSSPRAHSPPARVAEAAEAARGVVTAQALLCGDTDVQAMTRLTDSVDVPSPSPITSCDRHSTQLGAGGHEPSPRPASVTISRPSTSSVRGRSTIEISVDLDDEDTEDTTAGMIAEGHDEEDDDVVVEKMVTEVASSLPSSPPPAAGPGVVQRRSSPPRRPGARGAGTAVSMATLSPHITPQSGQPVHHIHVQSVTVQNVGRREDAAVPRAGLRERSISQANQASTKTDKADKADKTNKDVRKKAKTTTAPVATRPVHCIRTRGGGLAEATSPPPSAPAAHTPETSVANSNDESAEEAEAPLSGRRTTALKVDVVRSEDSGVETHGRPTMAAFDPVLKPVDRAETSTTSITPVPTPVQRPVQRPVMSHVTASAPSPSPTPCERDEEDAHSVEEKANPRVPTQSHNGGGRHRTPPRGPEHTPQKTSPPPPPPPPQLRTPRRGALPEPHHAPQQDVSPRYNGVAPAHLGGTAASPATGASLPASSTSPPVVGVPFAIRSAPHTPRPSATTVPATTLSARTAASSAAGPSRHGTRSRPTSACATPGSAAVAGDGPFSRAAGVAGASAGASPPVAPITPTAVASTTTPTTTTTPPRTRTRSSKASASSRPSSRSLPVQPPARPPSRDARSGRTSARASTGACAAAAAPPPPAPAVPRSRASSRGSNPARSRRSSSSLTSSLPAQPPLRTPSRHASPFFRTASQNTPPTPPRHRPSSPLTLDSAPPSRAAHRREPFYTSTVAGERVATDIHEGRAPAARHRPTR